MCIQGKTECREGAGGIHLPIAGYERLRLLVDQGVGNIKVPTRDLAMERVANVPNLGQHNLISIKRLTLSFDAPMRFYPANAIIRPRSRGKPIILWLLRPGNGLLKIKVRRRVAACNMTQRLADVERRTLWRCTGRRNHVPDSLHGRSSTWWSLQPMHTLFQGPGAATCRGKVYR